MIRNKTILRDHDKKSTSTLEGGSGLILQYEKKKKETKQEKKNEQKIWWPKGFVYRQPEKFILIRSFLKGRDFFQKLCLVTFNLTWWRKSEKTYDLRKGLPSWEFEGRVRMSPLIFSLLSYKRVKKFTSQWAKVSSEILGWSILPHRVNTYKVLCTCYYGVTTTTHSCHTSMQCNSVLWIRTIC